ncbi:hypothetical protein [Streptomyces sp. NPDC088812]|uniref:hypothetical protein n=1 Tax=Streptomyces sp. NPDC088812 TaxID=3365905 RepID=UPI003829E1EC
MKPVDPLIVFRPTVVQRALPGLVALPASLLLTVVLIAFQGERASAAELWQWTSGALIAVVAVTFLPGSDRVTLTPDALVVVGLRRRRIPWAHILRLEVRRSLGVRQVIVWTVDGRGTTLQAPTSPGDPEFEAKVRTLVEWWEVRRSVPAG